MATNILSLPKIDGANTSFFVPNNSDWLDSMYFSQPGFGPPVPLQGCILTASSNLIGVPSALGIQPGMQISATPGLIGGGYVGAIPSTTTLTCVSMAGSPILATASTPEATLTFNPAPLDLSGISFIASLRQSISDERIFLTAQTADSTMLNFGVTGVLGFNVPAGAILPVPVGAYVMDILAIADGHVVNMMPQVPAAVTIAFGISDASLFNATLLTVQVPQA
jgi:hypothetical protein